MKQALKRIGVTLLVTLLVGGVVVYWQLMLPAPDATAKSQVGDKAPELALASTVEPRVTIADVTSAGPAVLVFYRGDW